jgi:hypothetical protein
MLNIDVLGLDGWAWTILHALIPMLAVVYTTRYP